MWIGSRRKRDGILLSIGNSKRSIAGQFILEGVLILAVSVILAWAGWLPGSAMELGMDAVRHECPGAEGGECEK